MMMRYREINLNVCSFEATLCFPMLETSTIPCDFQNITLVMKEDMLVLKTNEVN